MTRQKITRVVIGIMVALTFGAWSGNAAAVAQQLSCILTDTVAQPGSQSRPVTVVYDADNKTLTRRGGWTAL